MCSDDYLMDEYIFWTGYDHQPAQGSTTFAVRDQNDPKHLSSWTSILLHFLFCSSHTLGAQICTRLESRQAMESFTEVLICSELWSSWSSPSWWWCSCEMGPERFDAGQLGPVGQTLSEGGTALQTRTGTLFRSEDSNKVHHEEATEDQTAFSCLSTEQLDAASWTVSGPDSGDAPPRTGRDGPGSFESQVVGVSTQDVKPLRHLLVRFVRLRHGDDLYWQSTSRLWPVAISLEPFDWNWKLWLTISSNFCGMCTVLILQFWSWDTVYSKPQLFKPLPFTSRSRFGWRCSDVATQPAGSVPWQTKKCEEENKILWSKEQDQNILVYTFATENLLIL